MKIPTHSSMDRDILLGQQPKAFGQERVFYDPRKDPLSGDSRALDPNDPIDKLIIERLAERESLGLSKVSDPFETGRRAEDQIDDAVKTFGRAPVAFGKKAV